MFSPDIEAATARAAEIVRNKRKLFRVEGSGEWFVHQVISVSGQLLGDAERLQGTMGLPKVKEMLPSMNSAFNAEELIHQLVGLTNNIFDYMPELRPDQYERFKELMPEIYRAVFDVKEK